MTTLSELVELVAADLQDPDHEIWAEEDQVNNIRRAVAHYSTLNPRCAIAVAASAAGVREYGIAELHAMDVIDVWYPYDPDGPAEPPRRVPFWLVDSDPLYLASDAPPSGLDRDRLRIFYLTHHTVLGLDGASETTLDVAGIELVLLLATASAAMQRCQSTIGKVTVSGYTPQQLLAWAEARQSGADRAWEALRRRLTGGGDARVPWELSV